MAARGGLGGDREIKALSEDMMGGFTGKFKIESLCLWWFVSLPFSNLRQRLTLKRDHRFLFSFHVMGEILSFLESRHLLKAGMTKLNIT